MWMHLSLFLSPASYDHTQPHSFIRPPHLHPREKQSHHSQNNNINIIDIDARDLPTATTLVATLRGSRFGGVGFDEDDRGLLFTDALTAPTRCDDLETGKRAASPLNLELLMPVCCAAVIAIAAASLKLPAMATDMSAIAPQGSHQCEEGVREREIERKKERARARERQNANSTKGRGPVDGIVRNDG